jgi:hypothetical protein
MDSADQQILHLNSHGSAALGDPLQANNRFTNLTTQPIKNVSKIGLLYAAVPKIWDTIHEGNRTFGLTLHCTGQADLSWNVPMPLVNYYPDVDITVKVDSEMTVVAGGNKQDSNAEDRDVVNFAECLMYQLNTALA